MRGFWPCLRKIFCRVSALQECGRLQLWQSEPGQAVLKELDIESNPVQQQVYVRLPQIGDEAASGSRLEYP